MGKAKNSDKKKNGCVMWLAAFSLLVLLFIGGYIVFGRSSGVIPVYEGVSADEANYVVVNSIQAISFPNYESDRASAVFGMMSGTYLFLTEDDYEFGGFYGESDVWWRIEVDGDRGFVPFDAVQPISEDVAVDVWTPSPN